VGGAFAGAGAWLASAGRNIIDGLVNGLRNAAGSVGKTLLNIAKDAIDGFKSFFGIKSPSRLMMGLGKFLPQGLAKGITNGLGYVTRAMGSVNDAVTGNFSPSLSTNDLRAKVATAGGFGSSQTNINVSVDGGISTAPEIGRAVVEAIKNYQATGGRQAVLA
jgi:phage-related protein